MRTKDREPLEVAFDGRLGAAPQEHTTSAGKPWSTFSLAVGRGDETEMGERAFRSTLLQN
jgi:hypothetical protein